MSKSEIDRIQELLLINSSLRDEIRGFKEMITELLEEIVDLRERLDSGDFRR